MFWLWFSLAFEKWQFISPCMCLQTFYFLPVYDCRKMPNWNRNLDLVKKSTSGRRTGWNMIMTAFSFVLWNPKRKPSKWSRSQSRRLQTQITLEILDKVSGLCILSDVKFLTFKFDFIWLAFQSKAGDNSSQALGHPHRFVHETFANPTHCAFCNQLLWGNGRLGN